MAPEKILGRESTLHNNCAMRTWTTETWIAGEPAEVLAAMVDPDAIARWSPVRYELLELDGERLGAGSRARVRGALGGRLVEFTVHIHEANDGRLALVADGPVAIDAEYLFEEARGGSWLRASVRVGGRGVVGVTLARMADGLLAAGLLRVSVARLARDLQAQVQP
jgi:uncharacterized protein YndB with AHSA1/START domain